MSAAESPTSSSTWSSDDERHGRPVRMRVIRPPEREKIFIDITKLNDELNVPDDEFEDIFGASRELYTEIQDMVLPDIENKLLDIQLLRNIKPRDRLALCLRFMSSGKSSTSLGVMYHLDPKVFDSIIEEICQIIVNHLQPRVMPRPTKKIWENNVGTFRQLYDMPNCLGSLIGKYIDIEDEKPYVFLALVDANYRFIVIDVGNYTSNDPQSIWAMSDMGKRFDLGDYSVPGNRMVDNYPVELPHVIVSANLSSSKAYFLSNFQEDNGRLEDAFKIFNCRILPVMEVAEEAMRRLGRRWQILQSTFRMSSQNAALVLKAACCIHNYLISPPK